MEISEQKKILKSEKIAEILMLREDNMSTKTKKVICPGCGKVETLSCIDFDFGYIEKRIKENQKTVRLINNNINGIKWCNICH
jgi:hypothetical protein